jgi:DNA (cytosine-5)-methyltransferase 1
VTRPRLLDLFCGQGGAGMGYSRADFEVVGVDLNPQPRYPFEFHQGDAIQFLAENWEDFDAFHASPPCQAYTALKSLRDNKHPQLVVPTRWGLQATGKPYVIENVPGSPLVDPIVLCGSMFHLGANCRDGVYRQLRRHRLFESNVKLTAPNCKHDGPVIGVYGTGGGGKMTRGYKGDKKDSLAAICAPWMDRKGISQSIPPAYTEYIGKQLMVAVRDLAA